MKKDHLLVIVFGILFLFIIQSAGTLVESIYILDLMNSNLDEKALGVLFFFTPLLVLPFYKKYPRQLTAILLTLLIITRGLTPYLNTSGRLVASGIATGASLSLLFLLIRTKLQVGHWGGAGLALAVALSALLRAAGEGIEYSLTPAGGWVGWVLGILLGGLLMLSKENETVKRQIAGKITAPILGIYLLLTLIYFSFSAPAVIARWTEGNYLLIVSAVSLLSLGWVWVAISRPQLIKRISRISLFYWNLLFTASLTATLLAHRVSFPPTLDSPAVVVGASTWLQQVPLVLMLLLFPVLFLDLQIFLQRMQSPAPESGSLAQGSMVPGILLGTFALVVLIFVNIFSNVWGYIDPVSPPFRNTFWLAYFLLSAGTTLLVYLTPWERDVTALEDNDLTAAATGVLFGVIFVFTLVFALPCRDCQPAAATKTSLRVMTFNTQQSNDDFAEKSFEEQLDLIRRVSPDILALQESDSARISLNNNDYVRYFAEKLGYYSYYGPTPGTGTFGTAILSKYPLLNTRSVFIYSDKDETGVAEAEIEVNGMRFTIYDVHPDSSDPAMLAFARTLVERAGDQPYAIALGDYNLRDYEEAYQLIDSFIVNAWTSVYPTEISADGVDMSGDNRIDHIFLSPNLTAVDPTYILPPESATDHPVHWTDIVWSEP
jgi:endonuclease/exonuclease/phosphatase family metal-dependent hydrolase